MAPKHSPRDIILPMTNDWMQRIVCREKNHEFRRYRIAASVQRVWFYLNAPFSHIAYVCEIDPARTRNPGDEPLPEDGLGNKQFNERHKDMEGWDFAYRVRSVYRLVKPIPLAEMRTRYGLKSAPRGMIYTPEPMKAVVNWSEQECIWTDKDFEIDLPIPTTNATKNRGKRSKKEELSSGLGCKRRRICELGISL